jgi:putative tryptophan/tyrosine transport system substrate-binding protein
VTGSGSYIASGKLVGLLKEVLPKLSNVRIVSTGCALAAPYASAFRNAAKAYNVSLSCAVLGGKVDAAEYERVFATFEQDRPDALIFLGAGVNFVNRAIIVELTAKYHLPALYELEDIVRIGGLMAYSLNKAEMVRSVAHQLSQILNGTNPRDIPFNLMTRYELGLNLKTAKSLGLEFPATLLVSAE